MKKKVSDFLLLAAGAVALAVGASLALRHDQSATDSFVATDTLFAQTFDDANGQPQPVRQWQGQLLVVNFWATWCAPCVDEMPELQAVHDEFAPRGVTVIGLAIDNPAAIREFRDRLQLTLPLLVAGAAGSDLGRQYGNKLGALPYTILVSPDGKIIRAKLGRVTGVELRTWLREQLSRSG